MVPAAVVTLDSIPLSSNARLIARRFQHRDYAPTDGVGRLPETAVQQIIAGIWSDVLKLDTIHLDDDFFRLGGHSLLATRVVSRFREAFNVELPLREMFENATVAGLATRVDAQLRSGQLSSVPPLTHARRDILFHCLRTATSLVHRSLEPGK